MLSNSVYMLIFAIFLNGRDIQATTSMAGSSRCLDGGCLAAWEKSKRRAGSSRYATVIDLSNLMA